MSKSKRDNDIQRKDDSKKIKISQDSQLIIQYPQNQQPVSYTQMVVQFNRKYSPPFSYLNMKSKFDSSLKWINLSEASQKIYELVKSDDINQIKNQFTNLTLYKDPYRQIPKTKHGMSEKALEIIFLVAATSNARETVNYLGRQKLRLLQNKPNAKQQKLLREAGEIYIYKANNGFYIAGCKRGMNSSVEVMITDIGIANILSGLPFQNQINTFSVDFEPILAALDKLNANLPFIKDFKIPKTIIEDAIALTSNNPEANIPMLWDLLETANHLKFDHEFKQQWTDDPVLRDANAVRDIFIRAIKYNDVDLMRYLSQAPFRSILEEKPEVFSSALKLLAGKEDSTLYWFLNDFASSCKLEDLVYFYWQSYVSANVNHLNIFIEHNWLRNNSLIDLDSQSEVGKFASLLNRQNSIFQIDYLYSMIINGAITQSYYLFLQILDGFEELNQQTSSDCTQQQWKLISIDCTQQQWKLISMFIGYLNSNELIKFAIQTASPFFLRTVLKLIKPQNYDPLWFNNLMIDNPNQAMQFKCLITLLNFFYREDSYFSLPTTVLKNLANDILMQKDPRKEQIFNHILKTDPVGIAVQKFFSDVITQKSYQPYLNLLSNHSESFKLEPLVDSLELYPDIKEKIIKSLIQTPKLFKMLSPQAWLAKLKLLNVDSYSLRKLICVEDTWREYLKLSLLKKSFDYYIPQDIWIFITLISLDNKTHLIETDIECTSSLEFKSHQIDLVIEEKGSSLRFLGSITSFDSNPNIEIKPVSLKKAADKLSFFKENNPTLYGCPALKQEIVDKVKEADGHIPDIRARFK